MTATARTTARIRQRLTPLDDGGSFFVQNRPPVQHLPEGFADLFAEYDRLFAKLAETERDAATWRRTQERDEHAAIEADARAAGEAARGGVKLANPTANLDAVRGRLNEAEDAIPALRTALSMVLQDLTVARGEAREADLGAEDRLSAARQRLTEAAAEFTQVVEEFTVELAKAEWVHLHQPWDTSARLRLGDLPGADTVSDLRELPVDARQLIKLITQL